MRGTHNTIIMKSLILNFVLVFAFASMTTIATATNTPTSKPVTEQIHDLLKDFPKNSVHGKAQVLVQLIITKDSEVVVLSTDDRELDSFIKISLNYHKIEDHNLEINTVYTLPVTLIENN